MFRLILLLLIVCSSGHTVLAQGRCNLSSGKAGRCVSRDQCPSSVETTTINEDGSGLFDVRAGWDCSSDQVCCAIPTNAIQSDPSLPAASVQPAPVSRSARMRETASVSQPAPSSDSSQVYGIRIAGTQPRARLLRRARQVTNQTESCGFQKVSIPAGFSKKLANEANPGEYPWTVSIMSVADAKQLEYIGTGVLIHEKVVLTAAHVLLNRVKRNLRVVLGEHDMLGTVLKKKALRVQEVQTHNEFNGESGKFNVALLYFASSALQSLPNVGTVCLPPANYVPTAGQRCVFSGWGPSSKTDDMQYQLTKTEVPMMSHAACEERIRSSPLMGPGFSLLDSLVCAGGEAGRDICGGAGGSPLVCPIEGQPGRYVLTGLVSYVLDDCGVNGFPVVFSNVASIRSWIDQELQARSFATDSYNY